MPRKSVTGQYGIRRIGPRKWTVGYLSRREAKAEAYEFGYGTVWATSKRGAKMKLKKLLDKKFPQRVNPKRRK